MYKRRARHLCCSHPGHQRNNRDGGVNHSVRDSDLSLVPPFPWRANRAFVKQMHTTSSYLCPRACLAWAPCCIWNHLLAKHCSAKSRKAVVSLGRTVCWIAYGRTAFRSVSTGRSVPTYAAEATWTGRDRKRPENTGQMPAAVSIQRRVTKNASGRPLGSMKA